MEKKYGLNTKDIIDKLRDIGIYVINIETKEGVDILPTIKLEATYKAKENN